MSNDLRVNWDAVSWNGDQGSYEILRSTDNTNFTQIATVASGTTQYDDIGVSYGTTYYYKVRAVNSAGSSTSSSSSETPTWNITVDGETVQSITIDGTEVSDISIDGTSIE